MLLGWKMLLRCKFRCCLQKGGGGGGGGVITSCEVRWMMLNPGRCCLVGRCCYVASFVVVYRRGSQKATSALGVASAQGVAHWKYLFTPLSTISKRNLDEDTLKLLQRLARKKKNPVVREKQNSFLLTGGDNVAESLVQVGKKQLRRLSQLGGAKDRLEHRNLLAAYYIHKNLGLDSVLNALRLHREKTNGALAPANCFKRPLWT